MPNYTFMCVTCDVDIEQSLSLKEYDMFQEQKKYQHAVQCPKCSQYYDVVRTYSGKSPGIKFGPGFFKDGYDSAKNITRKEE